MTVAQVRDIVPDIPQFHRYLLNGDGINTTYVLPNAPVVLGSVSVRLNTSVVDPADYTIDLDNGLIIFDTVPAEDDSITVDYKYTLLSDSQINTYMSLVSSNVRLAAAMALDAIATNQALLLKVISVFDLRTDGAAVARALRAQAQALRDAVRTDDSAAFDIAEWVVNDFSLRQVIRNDIIRNTL